MRRVFFALGKHWASAVFIDAVDIGIDLTCVAFRAAAARDCGQVRRTAAEGGDSDLSWLRPGQPCDTRFGRCGMRRHDFRSHCNDLIRARQGSNRSAMINLAREAKPKRRMAHRLKRIARRARGCSPVATNTSVSRALGDSLSSAASEKPVGLASLRKTTTTRRSPLWRALPRARRRTDPIDRADRSPPYFCTSNAIATAHPPRKIR